MPIPPSRSWIDRSPASLKVVQVEIVKLRSDVESRLRTRLRVKRMALALVKAEALVGVPTKGPLCKIQFTDERHKLQPRVGRFGKLIHRATWHLLLEPLSLHVIET